MSRLLRGRVLFCLGVLLLFDLSLGSVIHIQSVRPIFLYLMIVYVTFAWGFGKAPLLAFWIGILRDLSGSGPMGLETTILFSATLLLDFLVHKIEREFLPRAAANQFKKLINEMKTGEYANSRKLKKREGGRKKNRVWQARLGLGGNTDGFFVILNGTICAAQFFKHYA